MGLGDHVAEQQFPYGGHEVFSHLLRVLPAEGFKVAEVDATLLRVRASTSWSILSFGETVSISVVEQSDRSSLLRVDSGVKLATNYSGSHRNRKNIDKIIFALSRSLQAYSLTEVKAKATSPKRTE